MPKFAFRCGLAAASFGALLAFACGGSPSISPAPDAGGGDSASPPPLPCVPGHEVSCACPSGGTGAQTCTSGGDGYGACVCSTHDPDAGADSGFDSGLILDSGADAGFAPGLVPDSGTDSGPIPDSGTDSGPIPDSGTDAGFDSGSSLDAGTDSGFDSGTDAGTFVASDGGVPAPSDAGTAPSTTTHNFALHHLHLGDELDSLGNPDWNQYGYNLDGKVTTSTSTDVCTLFAGANAKNQTDGPGGIDNSFGSNIVPLIGAVEANPSQAADTAIASGQYTWMFDVTGLSADPAQTSNGLGGQVFLGVAFGQGPNGAGSVPTFTAADNWPLDRSYVTSAVGTNGTLAAPVTSKDVFSGAYIVGGELVSGVPTSLQLVIAVSGVPLALNIQHAVVTFHHPTSTHAASGIIAGVIATQDLVSAVASVAGNISTALCSGSTFAQVAKSIEQASDIMADGTNAPGAPCDGISIGLGFDADEIGLPQVGLQAAPAIDPCDAGDGG